MSDPIRVLVSRELLAELGEWSEAVQVRIEEHAGEYDMIFRRPEFTDQQVWAATKAFLDGGELHTIREIDDAMRRALTSRMPVDNPVDNSSSFS